jgi:tetratricopeptide (TPR) repeat protein
MRGKWIKKGAAGLGALVLVVLPVGCEWADGTPDGGKVDIIEFHSTPSVREMERKLEAEPVTKIHEPAVEPESVALQAEAPSRSDEWLDIAISHMDDTQVDHLQLARDFIEGGDSAAALVELGKALFDNDQNYDAAFLMGQTALRSGKKDLAEKGYRIAIQIDAENPDPWIRLSRISLAIGNLELAEERAERASVLDSKRSEPFNLLGRVWVSRSHWDKAILFFHKAVTLAPENRFYRNNLGYAFLLKKDYSKAIEQLQVAAEGDGIPAYVLNNLGLAYEGAGRLQDAITTFGQAVERHPKYVNAKINLDRLTVLAQRAGMEEEEDSTDELEEFEDDLIIPDPESL